MVVANHHIPLLRPTCDTVCGDLASSLEPNSGEGATVDIRSSIDRIGEQPVHSIVARQAPLHAPPLSTTDSNWQLDSFLPQPQDKPAHAANLSELAEHERQRLADPLGRVLFQTIISTASIADRHRRVQLAALCLQTQRLV